MRALRAFFVSFGGRNLSIALYGWAATLGFGTVLFFGLQQLLRLRAGRSLQGVDVSRHGLFTFFSDLLTRADSGPALLLALAAFFLLLFVPVTVFLSAGAYAVLIRNEKTSFVNLFSASLENFGRFLLQSLINLLAWAAAAALSLLALVAILRVNDRLHSESGLEAMLWVWVALTLLVVGLASAIADFAKIFRLHSQRNCLVSFAQALRFVAARAGTILLLLLLYFLIVLAVNAAFWLAFGSWSRLADLPFGLLLLGLQSVVFIKYYLKVTLVRAQIHLLLQG